MTMDYNISGDTTYLIPMKLDMYNQPEAYYKSDVEILGDRYKLATEEFDGKATEARDDLSLTDGNYCQISITSKFRNEKCIHSNTTIYLCGYPKKKDNCIFYVFEKLSF